MEDKLKNKVSQKTLPPTAAEKAAKRAERKKFQKRKKALLEREKENYGYIAFIKATGGFYICVGHSAVILARKIARTVGLRFALRVDRDFGEKSKQGIITITKRDYYRDRLQLSPYLTLFKDDEENLVFKLDRDLTPEEYLELEQEEIIKREELEKAILKTVAFPKISKRLLEILQISYRLYCKTSDACSRRFILDYFCDRLRVAHFTFLQICRKEQDKIEGLTKIADLLSASLCDLVQISELRIWGYEDCAILSTKLVETQNLVKNTIDKEKKK